jgi:hypothetical protein
MTVEIANRCPRCGDAVHVAPMHTPSLDQPHDLALGYQCVPCDWYVVQPSSNKLTAADFLAAALKS